jgi:hypothetical protein
VTQAEAAFPSFENDFHAPAQPVNGHQRLGWPETGGHVGEQEIPTHQEQIIAKGEEMVWLVEDKNTLLLCRTKRKLPRRLRAKP